MINSVNTWRRKIQTETKNFLHLYRRKPSTPEPCKATMLFQSTSPSPRKYLSRRTQKKGRDIGNAIVVKYVNI